MIIALGGRISSGKDTVAKMIQYYFSKLNYNDFSLKDCLNGYHPKDDMPQNKFLHGYLQSQSRWEIKKFATKLKKTVSDFTGCTLEDLESTNFKENMLYNITTGIIAHSDDSIVLDSWRNNLVFFTVKEVYPENSWVTFRVLLQDIGMKLRSSMPQIHINGLFSKYDSKLNWIISDLRLLNEAEAVKKHNGIIVKIVRKQENSSDHISETQTDSIMPNWIIDNDGSIDDLYEKVTDFIQTKIKIS